MTLGSLFSGIGGIDIGFERAGFEIAWQVELNEWCRKVLAKHWPEVKRHEDVRTFCRTAGEWIAPDVIAGGFPCQDVSNAGKREGIDGERSGLWSEFARIVRILRPRYVVVENVGKLTVRGLGRVLGDLCQSGFDAEWATIPASAFGAAHQRERLFIVAYAAGDGLEGRITTTATGEVATTPLDNVRDWPQLSTPIGLRSTNGFPDFVDRISGLGNAVVPQVAEFIARRIIEMSN